MRDDNYRPGGITLEMPPFLSGTRTNRVEQARGLQARAGTVVDKTRNLLTLEAEDAYFRWKEDSAKLPQLRQAEEAGQKLSQRLQKDAKVVGASVTFADAFYAGTQAMQLRLQVNETHYHLLLDLAALERITAGAVGAGRAPPVAAKP